MPRFSVVMPCYNGERYLEPALKSALAQTHAVEEVLFVDDGSTDRSREIAASLGDKVRILQQQRQGPSAARNRGIQEARGDWIAFLDADDYWIPEKLALQARVIESTPDCGLVYTSLWELTPDGATSPVQPSPPERTMARLSYDNPILPSTVVARRDLLLREPWSNQYGSSEDWDLFYRLSKHCQFGFVEQPTTYYRLHPESLSHRDFKSVLLNAQKVSDAIQRDFKGLSGIRRKRRVDARLLVSAARAARQAGSPEDLGYLLRSLVSWPIGLGRKRHLLLASMLLSRIRGR